MKTLTVRVPEELAAQIEVESRERKVSKSDVVRERLSGTGSRHQQHSTLDSISDLIGSVTGLPADLSTRKKRYLKTMTYGQKRSR